jgi:hypothetical protein
LGQILKFWREAIAMTERPAGYVSPSKEPRTFFDTGYTPSPGWAYTELWKQLVMERDALDELIERLQLMENATPKTQRDLKFTLTLLESSAKISLTLLTEVKTSPPEQMP